MGEFLRKYVSRRLLTLSEGEIAALMTAMRYLGVGSQGGALPIFDVEQEEELSPMPKDRGAEQGDVDGLLECSVALEWWQQRHAGAWLPSKRRETFRGLVLTTLQKRNVCKQNTQRRCRESPISAEWTSKTHGS